MIAADTDVTEGSVRLRLQRLPGPVQVLAVAQLAEQRSKERVFTTAAVSELFTKLRLPQQANLSVPLGRFAKQGKLIRPRNNVWAFTPEGEDYLRSMALTIDPSRLANELIDVPGATFGAQTPAIIPPFLSPAGTELGVKRLLAASSFENNVMLITRYPKSATDSFGEIITGLRAACAEHGLNLLLASDGNAQDTLWANVVTYMWACKFAIVLVDVDDGNFNSNVLIEVGGMLMTGRRCAILRDKNVPAMPTDLVGHIYREVDFASTPAVIQAAHDFMSDDLHLPRHDLKGALV